METTPRREPTSTEARADKIGKLLTQAESTSHPAEAETFLARATELMARWHIDTALVAQARADRAAPDDPVVERSLEIGAGHYSKLRLALLVTVAGHYCCRVLSSTGWNGTVGHVVGHRSDADRTLAMYGALSIHAARTMVAESPRSRSGGETIRWRRSFLASYQARIDDRLGEMSQRAQREAAAGSGGSVQSVALALRDRSHAADDWVTSHYPRLGRARGPAPVYHSDDAMSAGSAAADSAPLHDSVTGGHAGQVGAGHG